MSRVLIIGLDGASPDLISRWRGSLPNLSRLIGSGTSGILNSVIPPRSIPAWYCFATGMNPAKLGVFGFSQRRPGTYDYTFANSTFVRAPMFWEWLNKHGLKTHILHMPGTYPPTEVEGVMVSGWPAPINRGNLVYTSPSELSRKIDQDLGEPFEFLSQGSMHPDNDAEMLGERLRITRMHGEVARKILANDTWDLGLVVFSPLDRASHQFWRHIDPQHPLHDPDQVDNFGDALLKVYQACDEEVGRLVALLNPDDHVFIISDHGFGPVHRTFYINEWLYANGYLVFQKEPEKRPSLIGRLASPIFRLNQVSPFFRRLAAPLKKRALSNFVRDEYVRHKGVGLVRLNHLPVDWTQTRAYCPDEGVIYLNLRGRDPQGIVEPGPEAETLARDLIASLKSADDPASGQVLEIELIRKGAIYTGDYLAEAPELFLTVDGHRTEVMAEMGGGRIFVDSAIRSGTHTPDGVLIAAGGQISTGDRLDANLIDIAPTVIHLLGLPIPGETDGEVLQSLFSPESESRIREVTRESMDEWSHKRKQWSYTEAEEDQIEDRLRDLGYLG